MTMGFFDDFDYILAVDHEILRELYKHAVKPDIKRRFIS